MQPQLCCVQKGAKKNEWRSHQRDFLKYTAQIIKADVERNNPSLLEEFKVNAKDRKYQIGERNALSIDIYSIKVMEQKLKYVHENPLQGKWCLCIWPEEYKYSSAYFYHTGRISGVFLDTTRAKLVVGAAKHRTLEEHQQRHEFISRSKLFDIQKKFFEKPN